MRHPSRFIVTFILASSVSVTQAEPTRASSADPARAVHAAAKAAAQSAAVSSSRPSVPSANANVNAKTHSPGPASQAVEGQAISEAARVAHQTSHPGR